MPPNRAGQRATSHVPRPPRVYHRAIARLTRIAIDEGYGAERKRRTLHFLLHTRWGLSSRAEFVEPRNVPDFIGDVAWFEVEKTERGAGHPYPWWRAVRQVEPPADA